MPIRYLRDGILKSSPVDSLDADAEVFYRRLMSVVDDYGRFDARPGILRADCYPLRIDKVRETDISRWLTLCHDAGLIALYERDSKPYGVFFKLGTPRAARSKFPEPPAGIQCAREIPNTLTQPSQNGSSANEGTCDPGVSRTSDYIRAQVNTFANKPPDNPNSQKGVCAQVNTNAPVTVTETRTKAQTNSRARAEAAPKKAEGNPPPKHFPEPVGTPEERQAVREAFDRWSQVGRGGPIREMNDEHTEIHDMLLDLAQSAPVIRGGRESVPAYKLAALAADQMREEKVKFKGIKFACACVKNRVTEWATNGLGQPPDTRSRDRPKQRIVGDKAIVFE